MEYLLFALIVFTLFLCVLLIRLIEAVQIISGKIEILIDAHKEGNRMIERALIPMYGSNSGNAGFIEKSVRDAINAQERTRRA